MRPSFGLPLSEKLMPSLRVELRKNAIKKNRAADQDCYQQKRSDNFQYRHSDIVEMMPHCLIHCRQRFKLNSIDCSSSGRRC